ncbi:MAG: hypothetical protein GF353_06965 [Candidatus Lokiarchaeota archaeon]|nr:hypothetical protein [Candidatus Lokiarchaeota archaeon]
MQQQQPQQQQLRACSSFRRIVNMMFTFQQIYRAYIECRQNKRNTPDALLFECNQEENLIQLVDALNSRSYRPATSVCFYIKQPKIREIFAAHFRDRIVHHLVYNRLSPIWEKIFIDQSFACRPGKGTHKGATVLQNYLRKITHNGKRKGYYLKLDIHNYFMSINKNILYKILCKKCFDDELKWLLSIIIFHDPTLDYETQHSTYRCPDNKSLFNAPTDCGLPIGNLTSQFFANVYLNTFDQFVKHILKCRFYVRYVDDFILLSDNREQLLAWKKRIIEFLHDQLQLHINEKATRLDSIFNGVDFAGFVIRPFYSLCRRRVIGNCRAKLRESKKFLVKENDASYIWMYDINVLENLMATINSYLGHFQHAQTYKVVLKILNEFDYLHQFYRTEMHKITRKFSCPKSLKRLKQQVRYYSEQFRNYLILFQVGCYYESYQNSAKQLMKITGYKEKKNWRGFSSAVGFHQRFLPKVCKKLDDNKVSYVIVRQTGKHLHNTMERLPFLKVQFKNERNHVYA